MSKSYSIDLRERVAGFIDKGQSRRAAARHFGVSESFAIKLDQRRVRSGSIAPQKQGRPRGSGKLEVFEAFLIGAVEAKPDITMPELATLLMEAHSVTAAPAVLSRFLCRLFTYKKRMARPACKRLFDSFSVCANVSGLGAMILPGQDGAFARTGPHKHHGVWRHFFNQDVGTPFDCQAIFSVHSQTTPA